MTGSHHRHEVARRRANQVDLLPGPPPRHPCPSHHEPPTSRSTYHGRRGKRDLLSPLARHQPRSLDQHHLSRGVDTCASSRPGERRRHNFVTTDGRRRACSHNARSAIADSALPDGHSMSRPPPRAQSGPGPSPPTRCKRTDLPRVQTRPTRAQTLVPSHRSRACVKRSPVPTPAQPRAPPA
jgi:hypothetical protein